MNTLVLGTRNPKKIREIGPLLADVPIRLIGVSQLSHVPEIAEEGKTFLANASAKGQGVAKAARQWTLAEDSGLVVPALGNEPGVDSAIYAGKHGDDRSNNRKLLDKIASLPEDQRNAYYECVAVLCNPEGDIVAVTDGRCHGRIITEPRGAGGFGYDPLFLVPEYHKTFGELGPIVKAALSHRAKAIAQMRSAIIQYVATVT